MSDQEMYQTFVERYRTITGTVHLRYVPGDPASRLHAFPMRPFRTTAPGRPLCGASIHLLAATALPTADAPDCPDCLQVIRRAVGAD